LIRGTELPRRKENAKRDQQPKGERSRARTAYRPEARAEIDRLEEKRSRLGVSLADLASRLGCTERSLVAMRRDGRAFPRRLRAIAYALRTIERERQAEEGAFEP
jgi:hypothetical protein